MLAQNPWIVSQRIRDVSIKGLYSLVLLGYVLHQCAVVVLLDNLIKAHSPSSPGLALTLGFPYFPDYQVAEYLQEYVDSLIPAPRNLHNLINGLGSCEHNIIDMWDLGNIFIDKPCLYLEIRLHRDKIALVTVYS